MDLGKMLAEALERHGFAPPGESGVAASKLQRVAEEFLAAVHDGRPVEDRLSELRNEWAQLDDETADGELSANDIAAKAQRKAEIGAEMERLGAAAGPAAQRPATYRKPG